MQDDPVLVHDETGGYWRATSFDPAFVASAPAGEMLPRGSYRVRVPMRQRSGHLAGPRLYMPFAGGAYSEYRSVELRASGDVYEGEVFVGNATRELRFDPSIYPCEFDCGRLELTPVAGRGRMMESVRQLTEALGRLRSAQLAMWLRAGVQVLFKRGPRAFFEAAYWAIVNHARTSHRDYAAWVREFSTPSAEDLAAMAAASQRFERQPTVSFITPVYNTAEPYLRAMIESVRAQAYPRWELCLADDASTAPHVRGVLEEYAARDPRIKVAWRETNGHISAASNTALGLASGEYVALLDHDDAIPPDALYWVVRTLNEHPESALLYSDEDKLDFDGVRIMPYFKSDWNYDLFLSHNLITHLGVYRTDIVRRIGGFREGFEGAQDYDLALRFIEAVEPSQIRHIPRVLYHWRMLRGSTSVGAGEKDYAAERARLAIEEHLARIGIAAEVETIPEMAVQRVRYRLPDPAPLASIIIPTRNGQKLVRQCIESIKDKTTYAPYEILLVDNGSDERASLAYFHALRDAGTVRLLVDPRPFNFSRLNNEAAAEARGEFLVFLNNDVEVITPDWLSELVSHAQRPAIGAVGARLWYPNDTIQHAGLVLVAGLAAHAHHGKRRGDHGYFSRASIIQSLSAVTAACVCMRKAVFEEIGGFDETLAVAFNDVDLCLRIQAAGYRNLYTPFAELYHHESATRGYEDTPEKLKRFQKEADILRARWMPVLLNDPYYNPNLTLSGEPFTPAWPPRVTAFDPRYDQESAAGGGRTPEFNG
jgi:GT2 family glycosyltransferase